MSRKDLIHKILKGDSKAVPALLKARVRAKPSFGIYDAGGLKRIPPGLPTLPSKRVQCIHGKRVEEAVCVRGCRIADHRDGRSLRGRFAGDSRDRCRRNASLLFNLFRRVIRPALSDHPGIKAPADPPRSPGRSFSRRITFAMLNANKPSAPGLHGIHSSAFAAVSDIRGSTCTNFPRNPARPLRIWP